MLLKAVEDFKNRTLRALPTLLEKLAYVCSLRAEDGKYSHWGLSQAYGEQKAQDAIAEVHSSMATEMVRTPIREVCQQLASASERSTGVTLLRPETLDLTAPANGDELLSDHLRLIQDAVAAVAEQERSSPPGASPLPPPAR